MSTVPPAATALSARLADLDWVSDLLVAGSLATGDYVPGVSDLDLVAIVAGPVDEARVTALVALHRELDRGPAADTDLGCAYVDEGTLPAPDAPHPTWTHGELVHRRLSDVSRAELVLHGFALRGRPPAALLPPVTVDQVRLAARAELCGYWAWASARPWMWLDPAMADLGLTAMARGRYTMRTGRLLAKTEAIEHAAAPDWLKRQLGARRRGGTVSSPRLRTGWIAWRDARRTVRATIRGEKQRG
jgi:hypothetical protein